MNWKPKDKLYVNPYGWNSEPSRKDEVEYIRKDALLDWIKDQLKENAEWREVNPDDRFFGGKEVAFERLIDKINSL